MCQPHKLGLSTASGCRLSNHTSSVNSDGDSAKDGYRHKTVVNAEISKFYSTLYLWVYPKSHRCNTMSWFQTISTQHNHNVPCK